MLTVLLLCSAATAKPKAIKSKMKTMMSISLEAMDLCEEPENVDGSVFSLSLSLSLSLWVTLSLRECSLCCVVFCFCWFPLLLL